MDLFFKLLLVILLVLLNGFFVAAEFALVAIRKTRIDELARKGNKSAKLVQTALNNLDNYISSTQLGITIASLILGWVGEPALSHLIEPLFHFLPITVATVVAHSISVTIAFAVITFLHIVLGELAPKSISLQKSEATAMVVIRPLMWFTKIFQPFIYLLNSAGSTVLRLIGFSPNASDETTMSEEEIKMVLSQSVQGGALEKREVDMVYKVLRFADIPIQQIMIPRTDVVALDASYTLSQASEKITSSGHSRFPVYEGSIDRIIGFIHIKDLYIKIHHGDSEKKLHETGLIREIISIPETKPADEALYEMRKKRIHISVVNDEYGGTAGIVTIEDVIESIVGEIEDEFEKPFMDIEKQADGSFLVNGLASVDYVRQKIDLPIKGQGYTTVGGVVFGLLGKPPKVGDRVQIGHTSLEVAEIEGRRVKRLRIKKETKQK